MKTKDSFFNNLLSYSLIIIGCVLAAYSLECILVPNSILDGGINGIAIIFNKLSKINLSILVFILNMPFLYIGYKNLGKHFLLKAGFSMVVFSIFLEVFHTLPEVTDDMILALAYGGLLLGAGVGLVIKFGGCLDGTESVALVVSKNTSLSVGQVVLLFNCVIFFVASFLFGIDRGLYSLLTYFVTFKVIDLVSEGFESAKAAMIITENGKELAHNIYNGLGRTCTILEGNGLISGKKAVLYVVITRLEIQTLKKIINDDEHSNFVTISDVGEIVGSHIKSTKKKLK